jgi:hypothetical protein
MPVVLSYVARLTGRLRENGIAAPLRLARLVRPAVERRLAAPDRLLGPRGIAVSASSGRIASTREKLDLGFKQPKSAAADVSASKVDPQN